MIKIINPYIWRQSRYGMWTIQIYGNIKYKKMKWDNKRTRIDFTTRVLYSLEICMN